MVPHPIFSITVNNFVPKAITFGAINGNERDILTFGLYNGHIWVICIDDPACGVGLYRLDNHHQVKTFDIAVTKQKRPRKVCFADESRVIVCSSDHGIVYVFDRRSGDTLDELRIDASDWVQTIATTDCNGISTILAAKSREIGGPNEIFVWRKRTKKHRFTAGLSWSMMTIVQVAINMKLGKLVVGQIGRF
ncbi:hypothetical protein B0H10DRAFT_2099234 [Mycena sp. CBHHK59/15]|nr:hypothetical protein B0H10DRAFT_2099234 [Mycena sp. CBHHK59/15]